jgi:hypothetical protein
MTAIIFTFLAFSSKYELQLGKDCSENNKFDWNEISDSMMAVQLRTAPYASEVIRRQKDVRSDRNLLCFLSNNAMAADTIVFVEPIGGLTTKPWTLMSFVWIANNKDSLVFYRMRDMDAQNDSVFEIEKSKRTIKNLGLDGMAQLQLCKLLDKDSLKTLHDQGPPHLFDMMVTDLMGTRVVLFSDLSFKIDCITFENFVISDRICGSP